MSSYVRATERIRAARQTWAAFEERAFSAARSVAAAVQSSAEVVDDHVTFSRPAHRPGARLLTSPGIAVLVDDEAKAHVRLCIAFVVDDEEPRVRADVDLVIDLESSKLTVFHDGKLGDAIDLADQDAIAEAVLDAAMVTAIAALLPKSLR